MRKLIGKLVQIHNDSVLSDIFGVYLGSRINYAWDSKGVYPFHKILTPIGMRELCVSDEKLMKILKVLT